MMKLYKYRSVSQYSLAALLTKTIYFPNARELNDPCDAQAAIDHAMTDDAKQQAALDMFTNALPEGVTVGEGKGNFDALFDTLGNAAVDKFRSRGIYSLSEVKDHHLMWSHYADSHRGFCIEYELDPSQFKRFARVHYTKDPPRIHLRQAVANHEEAIREYYFTKGVDWAYEKEWRLLSEKSSVTLSSKLPITGFILGARMRRYDAFCLFAFAQMYEVKLYESRIVEWTNALEIAEVDQTEFGSQLFKRCETGL